MRLVKLTAAVLLMSGGLGSYSVAATETNPVDKAAADIKRVGEAGKYAFVVFHRGGAGTEVVRNAVKQAVEDAGGRAEAVEVDVADTANAPTLRMYGVDRAPIPLVLAIAPNGAVTGGFPGLSGPQSLVNAMFGPKGASCMKSLQAGKVVVICVEPAGSKTAEATGQVVAAFTTDPRVADFAESILIDTTDWDEHSFLNLLGLDPNSGIATTLLMTPPNRIAGQYTHHVSLDAMFADLTRAMAGATCGGGGCKPPAGGRR